MPIYDVENRFSYYKNYSDNILVGPSKPNIGDTTWLRSVSGSVVSGSEEWKAETILTGYVYKRLQPFFKSGEVRFFRIFSGNQTIKDSIVPDIVSIYRTGLYGSGSLIQWKNGAALPGAPPEDSILLLLAEDNVALTGSDNQRVNNIEWKFSFPYEKKYQNIQPEDNTTSFVTNIKYYFAAQGGIAPYNPIFQTTTTLQNYIVEKANITFGSTKILPNPVSKSINIYVEYNGYYDPTLPPNPNIVLEWQTGTAAGTYYNISQRNFFFFGINATPLYTQFSQRQGDVAFNQGPYSVTGSIASRIQGWKYGLYNGVSTNFSCVFRQNHYGQFRDMLEGRPYTKTYNNLKIGGPLDTNGGINFISGSALSGESDNYLTASIYRAKDVAAAYVVNPYGSGIFDKEYRASQPWHDDDPRLGT